MARTLEEQKTCTRCSAVKPVADFYPQGKYFRSECKMCSAEKGRGRYAITRPEVKAGWKRTARAKKYGLTPKEYDDLVGRVTACEICQSPEPGGHGEWHIDHNHETGKVRGILCTNCNLALGHFKDNRANLERANAYLEVRDG